MNAELIKFPTPLSIEAAVAALPPAEHCLEWGIQSMTADTVRAMILLASSRSEHYRYALAVTVGIAQYLVDAPDGSITARALFVNSGQDGTRIGLFDSLDTHVIQVAVDESVEEEYMMLLVLDDNHMVDGYIMTRLRMPSDHVVKTIKLPSAIAG